MTATQITTAKIIKKMATPLNPPLESSSFCSSSHCSAFRQEPLQNAHPLWLLQEFSSATISHEKLSQTPLSQKQPDGQSASDVNAEHFVKHPREPQKQPLEDSHCSFSEMLSQELHLSFPQRQRSTGQKSAFFMRSHSHRGLTVHLCAETQEDLQP